MFFGRRWRISSVVFVIGFSGLSDFNHVRSQTADRISTDESQIRAEKKGLGEIPADVATNNRISDVKPDPVRSSESPSKTNSSESSEKPVFVPNVLPFERSDKPTQLEKAYLDAFTILSDDNDCSRLYGGPLAIMALNELVKQLKPTYLDRNTGVRMSGTTTTIQHGPTGFRFRLFDKAELNLVGAFYRGNTVNELRIPSVGRFQPNTREARVTLLLHELGHLVKGADKRWLLPDDGGDPGISRENTFRVVSTCDKQIQALTKMSIAAELVKAGGRVKHPESARLEAGPVVRVQ